PDFGYCASQSMYYYGYKLHAVCGLSGVIHSYDLTQASVHDLKYLNDAGQDFFQCTIIGDKGYLSAEVQLNVFESAHTQLEVPYRLNQKDWKPFYKFFCKARKRVETDFSQFTDQFNIMRNYAKQHVGFFTRSISKASAFTGSQYLNKINNRPIGRIKYAFA
ncbi:MAG: IS982 family transposase, partial [Muribaculaceae bacterium]|nr:IS982 family transposase [Muribaculaceae bacterium]